MFISQFRYFTTAGSAFQEAFLYQERFINFFDGSRIFSQGRSDGCKSHRTALELIDNRTKYLIVYLIQSVLVNVKRLECEIGDFRIDAARTFHLCKVPHATQQGIGDTRRTAAAACDFRSSSCGAGYVQYACRTADNTAQHIIVIILQMEIDAETGT